MAMAEPSATRTKATSSARCGAPCCQPWLLPVAARAASDTPGPLAAPQGEDDGTTLMPVPEYLSDRDGEKPLGVYAIYDSSRNAQYVGYSRNIVLAVRVRAPAGRAGLAARRPRRRPAGAPLHAAALRARPTPAPAAAAAAAAAPAGAPVARGRGALRPGAHHGVCQQGDGDALQPGA
jgi:hypothetical protein